YSIDEVFIDVTHYLKTYQTTAKELAKMIILDIFKETHITATAGIGTNLYLCKVAMDIVAKHVKADQDGVRIASLNEKMYRQYLWKHRPITDFWRIGRGYEKKLTELGLYTMGDIAKCSLGKDNEFYNENLLYDTFGIHAELLIDHAWGYESCTMKDIKNYRPQNNSVGTGQILSRPYSFCEAKIVVKEMIHDLALSLVSKALVSDMLVLSIGYDIENKNYTGEKVKDRYGRIKPKHAHGTVHLDRQTASAKLMIKACMEWYDRHVDSFLTIRRISISACHVVCEHLVKDKQYCQQLDIFMDLDKVKEKEERLKKELEKEKRLQKATLQLKEKYGKNAVLKAMDYQEGATAKERNNTIGGHKA
ncbi:MAG: DNA methylase, partial [Faecalibacillus sp.]